MINSLELDYMKNSKSSCTQLSLYSFSSIWFYHFASYLQYFELWRERERERERERDLISKFLLPIVSTFCWTNIEFSKIWTGWNLTCWEQQQAHWGAFLWIKLIRFRLNWSRAGWSCVLYIRLNISIIPSHPLPMQLFFLYVSLPFRFVYISLLFFSSDCF